MTLRGQEPRPPKRESKRWHIVLIASIAVAVLVFVVVVLQVSGQSFF